MFKSLHHPLSPEVSAAVDTVIAAEAASDLIAGLTADEQAIEDAISELARLPHLFLVQQVRPVATDRRLFHALKGYEIYRKGSRLWVDWSEGSDRSSSDQGLCLASAAEIQKFTHLMCMEAAALTASAAIGGFPAAT